MDVPVPRGSPRKQASKRLSDARDPRPVKRACSTATEAGCPSTQVAGAWRSHGVHIGRLQLRWTGPPPTNLQDYDIFVLHFPTIGKQLEKCELRLPADDKKAPLSPPSAPARPNCLPVRCSTVLRPLPTARAPLGSLVVLGPDVPDAPDTEGNGAPDLSEPLKLMVDLATAEYVQLTLSPRGNAELLLNVLLTAKCFEAAEEPWVGPALRGLMQWLYGPLVQAAAHRVDPAALCAKPLAPLPPGLTPEPQRAMAPEEVYHALPYDRSLPGLDPKAKETILPLVLPRYQQRAVWWMLARETACPELTSPLWLRCLDSHNPTTEFHFNPLTGGVATLPPRVPGFRGGILADEMGLGKTIEVIACILLHRCQLSFNTVSSLGRVWQPLTPIMPKGPVRCTCSDEVPIAEDKPTVRPRKPVNYQETARRPSAARGTAASSSSAPPSPARPAPKRAAAAPPLPPRDTGDLPSVQCRHCLGHEHTACAGYRFLPPPPTLPHICRYCCATMFGPESVVQAQRQTVMDEHLLISQATLIVCPTNILHQWQAELGRVSSNRLRVFTYNGCTPRELVGQGRSEAYKSVQILPCHLACHDVVLTTYEAVRREVYGAVCGGLPAVGHGGLDEAALWAERAVRSPLVCLHWWRVVLDESQVVEGANTQVAQLACLLSAEHRWGVSGTPMRRGPRDLLGLLKFLQVPLSQLVGTPGPRLTDQEVWQRLFLQPCVTGDPPGGHARLLAFLRQVMWRTSKKDVEDELRLPTQHFSHWALRLSAVEQFYYDRMDARFRTKSAKLMEKWGPDCGAMQERSITEPLLALRQACSHPQVGTGVRRQETATMTMADLREKLIGRAQADCNEATRQLVQAKHGLAGVQWLLDTDKSLRKAAEYYLQVLDLSRGRSEWGDAAQCPPLLQLHALANLRALLLGHRPALGPLGSQEDPAVLLAKAEDLRLARTREAQRGVQAAARDAQRATARVAPLEALLRDPRRAAQWHSAVSYREPGIPEAAAQWLFNVLLKDIGRRHGPAEPMARIQQRLHDIAKARDNLLERLKKQCEEPSKKDVIDSQQCSSCDWGKKTTAPCAQCLTRTDLREYRDMLFRGTCSMDQVREVVERLQTKPARAAEAEVWTLFTFLLLECDSFLALTIHQTSRLKDCVDLENAVERLRYQSYAGERGALVVARGEEQEALQKYTAQHDAAAKSLHRHRGNVRFLKSERLQATDPCIICQEDLGDGPAILGCGHGFHAKCVDLIRTSMPNPVGFILCPTCRTQTPVNEVNQVSGLSATDDQQSGASASIASAYQPPPFLGRPINGDWGTKIGAVVQLVLALQRGDLPGLAVGGDEALHSEASSSNAPPSEPPATPKVIVFSQWKDVLELIQRALTANGVRLTYITGPKAVPVQLPVFQSPTSGVDVLLLPLSLGAKGLNITEATHVVMVEPLLSPDVLAQAIGRVHRFGQKKDTHVHILYTTNTIEEDIHKLYLARRHGDDPAEAEEVSRCAKPNFDALSLQDVKALLYG